MSCRGWVRNIICCFSEHSNKRIANKMLKYQVEKKGRKYFFHTTPTACLQDAVGTSSLVGLKKLLHMLMEGKSRYAVVKRRHSCWFPFWRIWKGVSLHTYPVITLCAMQRLGRITMITFSSKNLFQAYSVC